MPQDLALEEPNRLRHGRFRHAGCPLRGDILPFDRMTVDFLNLPR